MIVEGADSVLTGAVGGKRNGFPVRTEDKKEEADGSEKELVVSRPGEARV